MSYHINDAVNVAEAKRIGHGVDIMHESNPYQLINTLLNKNILVEINLTSNKELLGVQGNYHPVKLYMQLEYQLQFLLMIQGCHVIVLNILS